MATKKENTPTEQEQLLGEVKQELDDQKKKAIKKFVVQQLKDISISKADIEQAKEDCKAKIAEAEEDIAEAEAAIRAIEDGDFEDALTVKDRLTELPQTALWQSYITTTGTVYAVA